MRRNSPPNLPMDGDTKNKDFIHVLPNSIMEFILSMLTIKDAVNTSLVSRGWKHLWLAPILTRRNLEINRRNFFGTRVIRPVSASNRISYSHYEKNVFVRRVNAFLQLYWGKTLDSFKVNYFFNGELRSYVVLDQWVRFAVTKGVEVLELFLLVDRSEGLTFYVFPTWLLNYSTIKHLRLCRCTLRCHVNGLNLLQTLYLDSIIIDEKFMPQLFTTCLLLESVTLRYCKLGSSLVIAGSPFLALKDFKVLDCYELTNFEIHAENLAYLEFVETTLKLVSIHAPRLDKVFLGVGKPDDALSSNLTNFASTPRLGMIYLHLYTDLSQSFPVFRNLKQLNVDLLRYRHKTENVDLMPVLNLLNGAPMLEELTLTVVGANLYKNEVEMRQPSGFKHGNLRKVKMQGFQSNVYEIEFVLYILRNVTKLQQIIIDLFGKLYFGCENWIEVKLFGRENYKDSSWEERRREIIQEKLKQVQSDAQVIIL